MVFLTWSDFIMSRKFFRREVGEDGYSLVELTAATAGVLALTAGGGYLVYSNIVENNEQQVLQTAASNGYSEALNVMTGFEYDGDDTISVIDEKLNTLSEEQDYRLVSDGIDASSLCVIATTEDWVDGDTDPQNYAASGACGDPEEVSQIVDENTEDVKTTLIYKCDNDSLVRRPVDSPADDFYATAHIQEGNSIDTKWENSNSLFPMKEDTEYTIELFGEYRSFNNHSSRSGSECLREIQHIGEDTNVKSLSYLGEKINEVPKNIPPTVNSLTNVFRGSKDFNSSNVSYWNTSNVSSMNNAFYKAYNFDQDISNWDISNVKTLSNVFYHAHSFNQDISEWVTSNVTNMSNTFNNARSFNQPLNSWDTDSVRTMKAMFFQASQFNQPLDEWETGEVTSLENMFNAATSFNQNLNTWDTSSVENMRRVLSGASSFNNGDTARVSDTPLKWNTENVTNLSYALNNTESFNQSVNNWETDKVTDMTGLFNRSSYNHPLNNWETGQVKSMRSMFVSAKQFDQDISMWDTSNVTDMSYMFNGSDIDYSLNNWDTSSVTNMRYMFYLSSYNHPLNDWEVGNVTDMTKMFDGNRKFNQTLEKWDTSNVVSMSEMFYNATSFDQDISGWNVENVENSSDFTSYRTPIRNSDKLPNFKSGV